MRFVAGGCAFGLALVRTFTLGIPNETGQHSPSSARESNDCSQDFEKVVTELVAARDQALIMREDEALFTLTVEGSAVRAQDEDLLASLADSEITELHTRVDAVHLLDCLETGKLAQIQVWTTQESLSVVGEEPVGELPSRCAVWNLVGPAWKLDSLGECE